MELVVWAEEIQEWKDRSAHEVEAQECAELGCQYRCLVKVEGSPEMSYNRSVTCSVESQYVCGGTPGVEKSRCGDVSVEWRCLSGVENNRSACVVETQECVELSCCAK